MDVKESFQRRFEQALASSDLKPSELAEKKPAYRRLPLASIVADTLNRSSLAS